MHKPEESTRSCANPGLRFLGVGGASGYSNSLGTSAAVLEFGERPGLLIDCGPGIPGAFEARYGVLPEAIFITHVHLDHIAGLEPWYTRFALQGPAAKPVRIFAPVPIISELHARLGNLRAPLAEGGGNFWDAFQLVPVTEGFWHEGMWFDVFQTRHHSPGFSWGLRLAGRFLYSGDTRPIPEVLRHFGASGEIIFHDCALSGNPSHSGWHELLEEYDQSLRSRLFLYHFESPRAAQELRLAGAKVVSSGERYALTNCRVAVQGGALPKWSQAV